jgi:hypothetical protein
MRRKITTPTPIIIPNGRLWLDANNADSIDATGNNLNKWSCSFGTNNYAEELIGVARPQTGIRTQNSLNVIDFDGSSQYLNFSSDTVLNEPYTSFVVSKSDIGTQTQQYLIGRQSGGVSGTFFVRLLNGKNQQVCRATTQDSITSATNTSGTQPFVVTSQVKEGEFTKVKHNNNPFQLAYSTLIGANNSPGIPATIAKRPDQSSSFLDGFIAEIIIYSRVLNNNEVNAILDYLNKKWNIY